MKNLPLTLIIVLIAITSTTAMEIDTLWYRIMGAGAQDVDFITDDRYVIAWANGIEFWEVQQGKKEFFIPSEATGDFNFNEEYLVFAQDSTPKLLNWQTREVVEGFEKMPFKIDRIKTAKSKNEFMAKQSKDSNIIYFWDINSKQVMENINFGYSFEKDSYNWKRTIHEYGYVGNNDELIYVIIDDVNDVLQNIPPMSREKHYYVNFYNRETKELVDSVYSFTNTNKQFGGFNYLHIMKDRSKIAWNRKGGEISYYNITTKSFYGKFKYTETESEINDIDIDENEEIIAIADGLNFSIIKLNTNEVIQGYNFGVEFVKFSNNSNVFTLGGNSALTVRKKRWVETNVESDESNNYNLIITPNPSSNFINIIFHLNHLEQMKLDVIDLVGNHLETIEEGILTNHTYQKAHDVSNLPSGNYFIRLEVGNEILTKQFIKEYKTIHLDIRI